MIVGHAQGEGVDLLDVRLAVAHVDRIAVGLHDLPDKELMVRQRHGLKKPAGHGDGTFLDQRGIFQLSVMHVEDRDLSIFAPENSPQ